MNWVRLLVDVGNSRIKFGLFDHSPKPSELPECRDWVTLNVQSAWPWDQIRTWFSSQESLSELAVFVTGSNPAEIARMMKSWPNEWRVPKVVDYTPDEFPLVVQLPEPGKAGIDRLLNAVAANRLRKRNQAALIVDSGTATTVDAVSSQGAFLGGAILPGFELSARALHQYTALLPMIPLEDLVSRELPSAIGSHTLGAMRSGLFWGQVGAVKELLHQSCRVLESADPLILVTGGGGELLAPQLPEARSMPHLSLQGLALVIDALFRRED